MVGILHHGLYQGLMASMDTVEVANGQGAGLR
jgi:hypothetical protein